MSVSLDLQLINILEARGLNTTYTLINRHGFEQIKRGGGLWMEADFISQGIPPPILSPDICLRKNTSLLAVQVVSECLSPPHTHTPIHTHPLHSPLLGQDTTDTALTPGSESD